jgi:hypothetical protein
VFGEKSALPPKARSKIGELSMRLGLGSAELPHRADKRELTHYERLLEVATINLYQANAFRIAGLNVDASLRDVSKRLKSSN